MTFTLFLFLGRQIKIKIHSIFEIQQLTTNKDFGTVLKNIIRVTFVCYLTFNENSVSYDGRQQCPAQLFP